MSAPEGLVRPISARRLGCRQVDRHGLVGLGQQDRGVLPGGRERQPHGIVAGVEVSRPTTRLEPALEVDGDDLEGRQRLLGVAFGLARAEQQQVLAVGRDGQVVGIIAGQVPPADAIAVEVEGLPPARLDVSLVAGRASRARRTDRRESARATGRPSSSIS